MESWGFFKSEYVVEFFFVDFFHRNFFGEKIEKYFSRSKNFRKKSMKKLMKIKILKIFRKNRNFGNFNFHWLFHRFFSDFFDLEKYCSFFFHQKKIRWKKSDENFFDHIFRFKKSPRFQKSHLENCAMRPGPPSSLCFFFFAKFKHIRVDLA